MPHGDELNLAAAEGSSEALPALEVVEDIMRRLMFKAVVVTCVWALGIATRCQADDKIPDATRRPNILFLLGDDWAWPHASCLHYPEVKTPTFDRLVREGILFRNAH